MYERIVSALYSIEVSLTSQKRAINFATSIGRLLDERKIVFSTPVMTNAGRAEFNRPLTACTIPPISLQSDLALIREMVDSNHQEAMGTGFNLDEVDNPVSMLLFLNDLAIQGATSGKEDRPVGNIGICSIDHPRIVDFITSKQTRRGLLWKFNISVNTTESFWLAVQNDRAWRLRNGDVVYANELLDLIAQSAHACAEPGLIFMDRINRDNPVPANGMYHGVAPCAEVGLIPGETCQFGYINIGAFCHNGSVDLDGIKQATELMVRALDDCLEISIQNYSTGISSEVVSLRRKIGLGICGLADALVLVGIPYSSLQAREFARDVVAVINYYSKIASHSIAKERGSFGAMNAKFGCRYNEHLDYLNVKYGNVDTQWVTGTQWRRLGKRIKITRMLRNSSTIALPPTGRSALVISASTGVEPLFSLIDPDGNVIEIVKQALGNRFTPEREHAFASGEDIGNWCDISTRELLRTSVEIRPNDHLLMTAALQQVVDESVSKTINLPRETPVDEVKGVYTQAYALNLKGITMYRDGTSFFQPHRL